MSLVHMSGFEGAPKGAESPSGSVSYAAGGRTGMCMVVPGGNMCTVALPAGTTEIITGFAIKPLSGYDVGQSIGISLVSPSTNQEFLLTLSAGGNLIWTRKGDSGNLTLGSVPNGWAVDTYTYIEMQVRLHATTGIAKLWVNGVLAIDFSGNTKDDTASDRATLSSIVLAGPGSGGWAGTAHYDDFYVLDAVDATATQGRPFNSVIGMPKIELLPITGMGSSSQWVGSDGDSVDNHLLVDDVPPSSSDYVESSTTGDRDLYDVAAPTIAGELLAVEVSAYASSPDGGVNPIKMVQRSSGGTSYVGPGQVPSSTYKSLPGGPRGVDPDGTPWTASSINNATFGIEMG